MIDYLSPDFKDLPGLRAVPRMYKRSNTLCTHIDVSIITPYYNTGSLFYETFVSLQAQSIQNWEWVIVDDGSTDRKSVNQLIDVSAKDERIKVIRQSNSGPGAARNKGFRESGGRYICLLDSDDMVEPTYLEKCVWFLDSNPEFAFCNSYSVIFGEQEYLWSTGFERGKEHLRANIGPLNTVIRRSAFVDCGGFDESIRFGHEDWDFWLAMAKAGHWGFTIREFLQWYRKRGDGRFETLMRSENGHAEFERKMRDKYEGLENHFPEPRRRHPMPYETLETKSFVTNLLAANESGRRVMFIVPWMVTGGADKVNLDLVEGLVLNGHDVTICATLSANHCWEHQFSRFTPDIFVLPNFLHESDYPRFLAYLLQSRQIDTVVITGSTIGYQLLPYLRSVSPEVAFVDLSHVEEPHWLNGGHPRFGVGYQDVLDINIVTTKSVAKWMEERGADTKRIKVLYSGVRSVEVSRLSAAREAVRKELNIPANMPVIVFAGRICDQKRPFVLAEILKSVHERGMEFRGLVIGDGDLRAQFEDLLGQYSLGNDVQMLGSIPHEKWLDILIASDIFLMPSRYEGISIALLEAMAAGVVPVVADVGGVEEIVSGDAAVLVKHGDTEIHDYTDEICSLLSTPARLRAMSEQSKFLAVSKVSWEGMIDKFLALLDEAHHLNIHQPRNPISPGFGLEIASLSLECKRLGDAVDWLWTRKPLADTDRAELIAKSAEMQGSARFAVLLSQTSLGQVLIRSRLMRSVGKQILRILEK